jgi:hypothetical protein
MALCGGAMRAECLPFTLPQVFDGMTVPAGCCGCSQKDANL